MNVRAGILTFHGVTNFGAVLQAYALCRTLNELGCHAQIIDYNPDYLVQPYRKLGRRPMSVLRSLIRNRRFDRFRRAFIPTSRLQYRTAAELKANPPEVDVFVCGSDQVWNLKIHPEQVDESYFLGFVPVGKGRVAYAPSFGDTEIPDEKREHISRLISRFDFLSARETDGQMLIQQLTGRSASVVIDPTLLVSDYAQVIRYPKRAPDRYILTYPLESARAFEEFVLRVQQVLQLPIVNIGPFPMAGADYNHNCLGPSEWLGWLKRASFVCTNSFHGTAYSINFRKDFAAFPHQQRPGLNARLHNLLGSLQLNERLVAAPAMVGKDSQFIRAVNYAAIEPVLNEKIQAARDYLKNAMQSYITIKPAGRELVR